MTSHPAARTNRTVVSIPVPASRRRWRDTGRRSLSQTYSYRRRCAVFRLRLVVLLALGAVIGLVAPLQEASGQATPVAPPGVTARTTALLVTAIHDPLRVTGSDGMVHLEYDLVLTNVFTAPVTITTINVLTPDGQTLLRLEGDALEAMTQPLFGRTPTALVPQSGALAAMLDVVVPPDQVPERLTHRITYELAPDAPNPALIGSREIVGPELAVDPFLPVVIA